jgi:hypothetical protein
LNTVFPGVYFLHVPVAVAGTHTRKSAKEY